MEGKPSLNTIMTAALLGLMGWTAITTQKLSVNVAVQGQALRAAEASIDAFQAQVQSIFVDRYTATQAASDLAARDREIRELEERLQGVEREIMHSRGQ